MGKIYKSSLLGEEACNADSRGQLEKGEGEFHRRGGALADFLYQRR